MKNFNSNSRFKGNRNFSRGGFDDRGPRRPQLFDAVCAQCGKNCQVPFRPSHDKPVYCSDCFEQRGGGRDNDRSQRPSFRRDNFASRQPSVDPQLGSRIETLNKKLDIIIDLLSPIRKAEPAAEVKQRTDKEVKKVKAGKTTSPRLVKSKSKTKKKK